MTHSAEKDVLIAELAAELAGVAVGEDMYGKGAKWHECLRSDDPYCWADPEEVAEAVVNSEWFACVLPPAKRREQSD